MADDEGKDEGDNDEGNDGDSDDLGDAGLKALERERKARRSADAKAKKLEARLQELEDKDKGEVDKLRERNAQLEKDLDEAMLATTKLEVAAERGVKARWLSGSTREELEAAADEYLEDHPPAESAKPPPSKRPKPDLKGGSDPTDEPKETDPAKLAASVPRF